MILCNFLTFEGLSKVYLCNIDSRLTVKNINEKETLNLGVGIALYYDLHTYNC